MFYLGFVKLARRRVILNTPASKVRSASLGLVELNGLAAGPNVMRAPITGVPCYYYRTQAWQKKSSSKNNNWSKVADETMQLPFYLDDNTGRVLIDASGAEMDIHHDFDAEYGSSFDSTSFDLPGSVLSFLSRHDVDTDQKLRVKEYCIKPKNSLFVLGTLRENQARENRASPKSAPAGPLAASLMEELGSDVTGSLRADAPAHSYPALDSGPWPSHPGAADAMKGIPSREKIVAALLKAGIKNPSAWAAAGVDPGSPQQASAATAVLSGSGPASGFDPSPAVVVAKGNKKSVFFISWRSQRKVVNALAWKSALLICGAPLLSLPCAYYLLLHFGLVPSIP
jgi:hypothetical protein